MTKRNQQKKLIMKKKTKRNKFDLAPGVLFAHPDYVCFQDLIF